MKAGWPPGMANQPEPSRGPAGDANAEEQRRLILESIPTGLVIVDSSGSITRLNSHAEQMFGYGANELIGCSVECLVPAKFRRSHTIDRASYASTPSPRPMGAGRELVAVRKDGAEFPVEIALNPYETPEDKFVLCAVMDITERRQAEEALRRSEERYRALVENVRDYSIVRLDPWGRIASWNTAAEAITGFQAEDILGKEFACFYQEADIRTGKPQRFLERAKSGRAEDVGWRLRKDGSRYWADVVMTAVHDKNGQLNGFWKITRDLSASKKDQEGIQEKEALLRQVIDLVPYPIFAKNREGRFLFANRSCAVRMGFAPEELVGRRQQEVTPSEEEAERYIATDRTVLDTLRPLFLLEETFTDREGNVTILQTSKAPLILTGGETAVLGVSVDITARKRAEAELAHQALHDPLTGLPNRALFLEHLEHSLLRSKRHPGMAFAVLFLDIDRFKVVNDSLGHIAGDELLTLAAERLRSSTRQGDTIARLGGDEFALLLDDLQDPSEAVEVARRILRTLKKPLTLGTREFVVTASIGIAPGRPGYAGPKDILRDADIAMYRAKQAGRDRLAVFDSVMHHQAVALMDLEADLRRAVDRREFELHFQEIRSLANGELRGYEALLRWRHPVDGLRLPAQFLRLAEETGISTELGWWAVREACRQIQAWTARRSDALSVSVNLGSGQFSDPRLTERIASALEEHSLDPGRLKLEITETAIMESETLTASHLRELSRLGVGVEIDDFGTGYSSLSRLLHLPITAVKIDRSFIESLKNGNGAGGIVRSIVSLAHSLKLRVVAEGIETAEQLAHLRDVGCDYGQGFYFARPAAFDIDN